MDIQRSCNGLQEVQPISRVVVMNSHMAPETPPRVTSRTTALTYQFSTAGSGASCGDIVWMTDSIASMVDRLGAEVHVAESSGFCGFNCLAAAYELNEPSDAWTAGDVRAFLGQVFSKNEEVLLAFQSNYHELKHQTKRRAQKEVRDRGNEHKQSHLESGTLPPQYWRKAGDMKCVALSGGV